MKIYTRKGDQGETSLFGGTRVTKDHLRIEAYGTIDELNAWIGMLRDESVSGEHIRILGEVQQELFTMGSHLAASPETNTGKLPALNPGFSALLEAEIDRMELSLDPLRNFLLPGGHRVVSACHIARCVCRRAERAVVRLAGTAQVDDNILQMLNRLSDYLFVLSRWLARELGVSEHPWKPRG